MTEMEKIKAVFKFEEVNFDYFNQQINGVLCEIEQKHQHEEYIAEKINNCKRFFAEVLDNFHRRMTTTSGLPTRERLQSEFKAIVANLPTDTIQNLGGIDDEETPQ